MEIDFEKVKALREKGMGLYQIEKELGLKKCTLYRKRRGGYDIPINPRRKYTVKLHNEGLTVEKYCNEVLEISVTTFLAYIGGKVCLERGLGKSKKKQDELLKKIKSFFGMSFEEMWEFDVPVRMCQSCQDWDLEGTITRLKNGESLESIGKSMGISREAVRARLVRAGFDYGDILVKPRLEAKKKKVEKRKIEKEKRLQEKKDKIVEVFNNGGTYKEMAAVAGICTGGISRLLQKYNLPYRSPRFRGLYGANRNRI